MPSITYEKWDKGLDVRKRKDASDADRLRVLKNAYITTGKEIKKRGALTLVETLETGSKGIAAAQNEIKTFTHDVSLTHADTLFTAVFVPHPTDTVRAVKKRHYADIFQGYLYCAIEYDNGDVYHHYLDAGSTDSPAWVLTTAKSLGDYVTPVTPNGFRYECTTAGTTGGTEPTWPTTIGGTVVDGTVTWTCRSFVITDTNCPHTTSVSKQSQKLFAIDGEVTRFCATGKARDWTTASDAGFMATGLQQSGATDAKCVAEYEDKLVVFFVDGAQIWITDPDPTNIILDQRIFNIGTRYDKSPLTVVKDIFFLADPGFRSITLSTLTENYQDSDIGTPIDELVKPTVLTETVTNLLLWSEDFSQASWSKLAVSINTDVVVAPNLTTTADQMVEAASTDQHRVLQQNYTMGATPIPLTASVYIKRASGARNVRLLLRDNTAPENFADIIFDPDDGIVALQLAGTVKIKDVGNGWWRASITGTPSAGSGSCFFLVGLCDGTTSTYLGDGSSDIYLWGAQLEEASVVGSYVKTTSAAATFVFTDDPVSVYYPTKGQYWCINQTLAWVYTFSATSKLAAWSEYSFPVDIEDACQLNGELYLRSGDNVYRVDEDVYTDDGTKIKVELEMPFVNFKKSGTRKMITGADAVMTGTASLYLYVDPNDEEKITPAIQLSDNTQEEGTIPVEVCAVQVAPRIVHEDDEDFSLSALTFYFEDLGVT